MAETIAYYLTFLSFGLILWIYGVLGQHSRELQAQFDLTNSLMRLYDHIDKHMATTTLTKFDLNDHFHDLKRKTSELEMLCSELMRRQKVQKVTLDEVDGLKQRISALEEALKEEDENNDYLG